MDRSCVLSLLKQAIPDLKHAELLEQPSAPIPSASTCQHIYQIRLLREAIFRT